MSTLLERFSAHPAKAADGRATPLGEALGVGEADVDGVSDGSEGGSETGVCSATFLGAGPAKAGITVAPAAVAPAVNATISAPASASRFQVISPSPSPTSITHHPGIRPARDSG